MKGISVMKKMKIIKAVISSIIICVVIFAVIFTIIKSRPQQESNPIQTDEGGNILLPESKDPIEVYDKETTVSIEDGSFLVKEKKFTCGENNITVLRVENLTGKRCQITIKPQYISSDKSFSGRAQTLYSFSNRYVNYFIFNPNAAYDSFNYEFNIDTYLPDSIPTILCDGSNVTLDTMKIMREEDLADPAAKLRTALNVHVPVFVSETTDIYTFEYEIMLLDNSGNIYKMPEIGTSYSHHSDFGHVVFVSDVLWENKDDFEIPEKLQGKISAIVNIRDIKIYNPEQ